MSFKLGTILFRPTLQVARLNRFVIVISHHIAVSRDQDLIRLKIMPALLKNTEES